MKRIATITAICVAAVAVIGVGTGGALCKFALDCGIAGPTNAVEGDAQLIDKRLTSPAQLAAGYREAIVASGLSSPTDFAFLPDKSMLVAEKGGTVRRVDSQTASETVVLDLSNRIDSILFRGLITIAVDPDFARNHFFYVVYTPKPAKAGTGEQPTVTRFSRFTLSDDSMSAGHEKILVGTVTAPSCTQLPPTADCLPSDRDHNGAQLAFTSDGTLFLATGDGGGYDEKVEATAERAQDIDSLSGKVLHITKIGNGVPSNPFWNGDASANRSKVWALGLRNPFRLALREGSDTPIVTDVGVTEVEEIDRAMRGANLGWPCYEGRRIQPVYAATSLCVRMYKMSRDALEWPIVALSHPQATSITGGDFAPSAFPAGVRGNYVFADWLRGWLRDVRISADGSVGPVHEIGTGLPGPTAIHAGADGALYYAALNAGEIRRIRYAP